MKKTLRVELNNYKPIPVSLREDSDINRAAKNVSMSLADLYHHYYLDSYGTAPPDPDPTQFEHSRFLLPTSDFRFQGNGIGVSPAIRRHRSNELGQAFCRWFLNEHLDVTYFAHLEGLLDRQLQRPFADCRLDRTASGDTPDYLCTTAQSHVCLAEAKGRYSSVSFKNKEFERWRQQFSRVTFTDRSGVARSIKGHIVATRFATEESTARVQSTLFAEDPESPGQGEPGPELINELADAVRGAHFSVVAQKLRQPVLASALITGVTMPDELRILAVAWRVLAGPLQGHRFIGGYFAVDGVTPSFRPVNGGGLFHYPDRLRLDQPGFTFFGIEEKIFRQVVQSARSGSQRLSSVQVFETPSFFYSGFSVLRDGTALGPLEFFAPDEEVVL